MLSMKLIGNMPEELKKAKALYYRAFPKNERRSFPELVENRFGGTEVFCFYDDETFVGMACLLNTPTISHIIYLTVDESLRGRGYGSKALELLHNSKPDKKIMVDIEVPNERAENAEQRSMVKSFTCGQDTRKRRLNTNGGMRTMKFFLSAGRFPMPSITSFGRTCENNQRCKVIEVQ